MPFTFSSAPSPPCGAAVVAVVVAGAAAGAAGAATGAFEGSLGVSSSGARPRNTEITACILPPFIRGISTRLAPRVSDFTSIW